jgi:hypothetical protein
MKRRATPAEVNAAFEKARKRIGRAMTIEEIHALDAELALVIERDDYTLGDAPIQQAYVDQMKAVAGALDEMFNGNLRAPHKKTGFVLLVFPFGDDPKGRTNFISNGADRRDIITLFKEMLARFEGQPETKGHG